MNADTLAQGLSAFDPEYAAMEAGRVMPARLKDLAARREDFAFKITLAGRSFAPWLAELVESGYTFHLFYLWLPSVELAVARVAERVRRGGHSVPEDTSRRRYRAGLRNFFRLYSPLASTWRFYDNSHVGSPRLLAIGHGTGDRVVFDKDPWERVLAEVEHG